MKTLKELLDIKAALIAKANAFREMEGLTDEQTADYDAVLADIEATTADIKRVEALEAAEAEMEAIADPKTIGASAPIEGTEEAVNADGEAVHAVIKVDPEKDYPTPYANLGEQAMAILASQKNQGTDEGLVKIMNAAASGQNEKIDAEGGFLVQKDIADTIESKTHESGQILSRVTITPVTGNGLVLKQLKEDARTDAARHGGVQAFWTEEAGEIASSKALFRELNLKLRKVAALTFMTDELMEDATALNSELMRLMPEALAFKIEEAIFEGDGATKPLGFRGHASNIVIAKESAQAADTIVFDNITKMWARLWAPSRAKAIWLINQDVEPELDNLALSVGTGGAPAYLPANGLSVGGFATLKGAPVVPVEFAETLGDEGDFNLVDLSQYRLIEKVGTKTASSIHLRFDFDETAFRATKRVDGQSGWASALTPFKGTTTLSPFISLAERT